jgi:Rieske [2Fe-2S] domain
MYPSRPVRVVRCSELAEGQRVLKVHYLGAKLQTCIACWHAPCTGKTSIGGALGSQATCKQRARPLQEVYGRSVTLLRYGGKVFCVDSLCSHMGGPLGQTGDIEDMEDGSACIKCPWHNFRVRCILAPLPVQHVDILSWTCQSCYSACGCHHAVRPGERLPLGKGPLSR